MKMNKRVKWSFEGLPTVFETDVEKLETTVNLQRQKNWLSYDHPFSILNQENPATEEKVIDEEIKAVEVVKDQPKPVRKRKRSKK